MFQEAMKALKSLEDSINRVGAALEKLKVVQAPIGPAEIPDGETTPEKKPRASSKKAASSGESHSTPPSPATVPAVASPSPVTKEQEPVPSASPAPVTVPASETTKDEEDDFSSASTEAPKEPPKPITIDQLREVCVKLAGAKGDEIPKNIIKTIGNAKKLSEIAADKYPAVMRALEEVMK